MNIKKTLNRDLFVMQFVQFVSSPQTHANRVRRIRKVMHICPANLTETQWMKLWRGFYYAVWYTEMRKGGEELIEEMGLYENASYLLSGFKSLTEDWHGIDSFRIDKYMLLVRFLLRNALKQQISALLDGKVLFEDNPILIEYHKGHQSKDNESKSTYTSESLDMKANITDFIVSVTSKSVGLFLHICDIYLDELQKSFSDLNVDEDARVSVYYDMLMPFVKRLSLIQDERLRRAIRTNIFDKLIDQVVTAEPIAVRTGVLTKLADPFVQLASETESGKNRNCLYSLGDKFRSKIASLNSSSKESAPLKRRIVGVDRKSKKIKYEIGTSIPFVRSIVPLPLI